MHQCFSKIWLSNILETTFKHHPMPVHSLSWLICSDNNLKTKRSSALNATVQSLFHHRQSLVRFLVSTSYTSWQMWQRRRYLSDTSSHLTTFQRSSKNSLVPTRQWPISPTHRGSQARKTSRWRVYWSSIVSRLECVRTSLHLLEAVLVTVSVKASMVLQPVVAKFQVWQITSQALTCDSQSRPAK